METADSAPPVPGPESELVPITRSKPKAIPTTLARKPDENRPTPVPKIAPENPVKPGSPAPALDSTESSPAKLMTKVGRTVPEVDTDSLLGEKSIDLKIDEPARRESLAATAESIRRSLLEDDKTGTKTVATAKAKPAAPSSGPIPVPVAPKTSAAREGRPFAGGMTGAVFERFVHQAMTLGTTAVIATKPGHPTLVEPELSPAPEAAESLEAPTPQDPEDDVPAYVRAARKFAEPIENFPALPENNQPPGLNDFVISATHQTDFDMKSSSITFAGHVMVESSRFHLTCDKFVVHMLPEQKGMEYGEALGNVVIRMMENHEPTGHTGLARRAVYRPDDGEIVLSGWPRIVEETKELVGITADAQMILTTSGSVRTIGRNRTILKQ